MHWEAGRQGTGYRKLVLFRGRKWLPFDCYLIDYPVGSSIPTHTDPVEGKRHFRLNILLRGEDKFNGDAIFKSRRVVFFRPDIMPHSVEQVSSRRLIFSIGWAVK